MYKDFTYFNFNITYIIDVKIFKSQRNIKTLSGI